MKTKQQTQPKPTMSQVLHTSLLESHCETLNEIDNLKHDYAIVSAERNNLRAHAEALAEALREMDEAYTHRADEIERSKAVAKAREALKHWEEAKQ